MSQFMSKNHQKLVHVEIHVSFVNNARSVGKLLKNILKFHDIS